MSGLVTKQLKKDLSKLKDLGSRFTKQKKEDNPKVIPPAEETKDVEGNVQEEQEQVQAGFIIKYAKELDFEVVNEDGNRIHCRTIAEAEILSRLIELKLFFMSQQEK